MLILPNLRNVSHKKISLYFHKDRESLMYMSSIEIDFKKIAIFLHHHYYFQRAAMAMIVWYMDLQLPV